MEFTILRFYRFTASPGKRRALNTRLAHRHHSPQWLWWLMNEYEGLWEILGNSNLWGRWGEDRPTESCNCWIFFGFQAPQELGYISILFRPIHQLGRTPFLWLQAGGFVCCNLHASSMCSRRSSTPQSWNRWSPATIKLLAYPGLILCNEVRLFAWLKRATKPCTWSFYMFLHNYLLHCWCTWSL